MMYRRTLKQFAVLLLLIVVVFSCKKQKPGNDPVPPPVEPASIYESLFTSHSFSFCGPASVSNLKIADGTDIGTVTIGNDSVYLYMTYNLNGNWYLGDVHAYAGRESLIPKNSDGNPVYTQFPGKQKINQCDLRKTFTFRAPLSALTKDNNAQCTSGEQFYIAMRASVKQFSNPGDCTAGSEQAAWAAPFLINPGNANEWATAFYYCREVCPVFCAYSQGFWFSSPIPAATWCQLVKFGNLEVNEPQGEALWPPQNNWVKRAFFQGSALQLSMSCYNSGNPIPGSIAGDYNRVFVFLSTLTYTDLQNGTYPLSTDTTGVRAATGNIGRWICNNHCTTHPDSTACTGF